MPIYDYYCKKCDKKVNDVFSVMNIKQIMCPYCGGKMVRMPAAPSIRFKGDNWESNDHKTGDKK